MNNVVISQDETSLTVRQRHSLSYKLILITLLLLLGSAFPAYGLYMSGTNATLACAREPASGVVCIDRADWLGAFPRAWRYEQVDRAEVITVDGGRRTTDRLRLITAAGPVEFSSDHHGAYASAAPLINRFIASPSPQPLVLIAGIDWIDVASFSAILLVVAFFCLSILGRTGTVARFDADRDRLYLRREGFLRPSVRLLRFSEIINVYATRGPMSEVFLMTGDAQLLLCWFSNANSRHPTADASELADRIRRWLAQHQPRRHLLDSAPDPANLVRVAQPMLVYLLRHSRNGVVVRQGEYTCLRLDRIGGGPRYQRTLRRLLQPDQKQTASSLDTATHLLADDLISLCQVDLREAHAAANPQQREMINALLKDGE